MVISNLEGPIRQSNHENLPRRVPIRWTEQRLWCQQMKNMRDSKGSSLDHSRFNFQRKRTKDQRFRMTRTKMQSVASRKLTRRVRRAMSDDRGQRTVGGGHLKNRKLRAETKKVRRRRTDGRRRRSEISAAQQHRPTLYGGKAVSEKPPHPTGPVPGQFNRR